MNNIFKKIEIFVIVVVIAVIGIVYAFKQETPSARLANNTDTTQNQPADLLMAKNELNQPAPETSIVYEGVDGKNAMELLRMNHQVTVKTYEFGDFVTSINGITPDSNQFWSMYVNGQQSQVGASQYMTKNGDSIKWQIDQVQ